MTVANADMKTSVRSALRRGRVAEGHVAMIQSVQKISAVVLRDGVKTEAAVYPAPLDHELNGRLSINCPMLHENTD